MYYDEEIKNRIGYQLAKYFENNHRCCWIIKPYVPSCELCGGIKCNMMHQKDDLDNMVRDLRCDIKLENKSKRYKMYLQWIRYKDDGLRPGDRRELQECV